MKRVLITGGKGFFASRFTEINNHRFQIFAPGSKELNILDRQAVNRTISNISPEYVIHAAAVPQTGFCNENPEQCYRINVEGTVNIGRACVEEGSKLVFISTEQVFNGNRERGPFSERQTPCPDTVYGKNKLEAEKHLQEIADNLVILRLTWLFGLKGKNILSDTLHAIKSSKPMEVADNEFRGLTWVDEIAEKFPSLMDLSPGIYHTGSENNRSRYDIVCHIFRELGLEDRIEDLVSKTPVRTGQPPRDVRLNTEQLRNSGISFRESEEAIRNCIARHNLRSQSDPFLFPRNNRGTRDSHSHR